MNPPTKATVIGLTAAGAAYVLAQKKKGIASSEPTKSLAIHGFANPGFEAVREAFVENFTRRGEPGAAYCVYQKGEAVVDPGRFEMLLGFPFWMTLAILNPRSSFRRALLGSELAHDAHHIYSRNLEIPPDVALRKALYSTPPAARDQ